MTPVGQAICRLPRLTRTALVSRLVRPLPMSPLPLRRLWLQATQTTTPPPSPAEATGSLPGSVEGARASGTAPAEDPLARRESKLLYLLHWPVRSSMGSARHQGLCASVGVCARGCFLILFLTPLFFADQSPPGARIARIGHTSQPSADDPRAAAVMTSRPTVRAVRPRT